MAEMEYDSEDEILDQRSIIGTMSEDSEDEIQENLSVNDSATIYMDWVDHDLETIAAANYSDEYDELASPETDAGNGNDGDIQILLENSVVSGQGARTDHDVRPTESHVNEASSVHENLANNDLGLLAIGIPQNEVVELELDSLPSASSVLDNENREGCNGFPEQSRPRPTPKSKKAPKKQKCSICSKKIAYLPLHMKWCHSKLQQEIPTTKCPICLKEFLSLPQHMNFCHREAQQKAPKAKCPICSEEFRYLAGHMKMTHAETVKGTPKPQCPTSSKVRKSSSHGGRGRRDAPPTKAKKIPGKGTPKAKQCSVCTKKFMDLPHHMKSCRAKLPLKMPRTKCPICSKEVSMLPAHMKRKHREAKAPKTQCPICLKKCVYIYLHIRSAHAAGTNKKKTRKRPCPICSKKIHHLPSHMRWNHPRDTRRNHEVTKQDEQTSEKRVSANLLV